MSKGRERLVWLDTARGAAIIAMIGYHASWNLAHAGYIPASIMSGPTAIWTARVIASTFLFLAGFSLALRHADGFAAKAFFRRFAMIAASAAAVSAATLFAMPQAPVYFGILHCIAAASLIALAFLRAPAIAAAAAGGAVLFLPLAGIWFEGPKVLLFTGLIRPLPPMVDYAPLIPFAGVLLFGLAAGKVYGAQQPAFFSRSGGNALAALGRHSLFIYLLHQPLLFGATSLAATLVPPKLHLETGACVAECERSISDRAWCETQCRCVAGTLAADPDFHLGANGGLSMAMAEKIRAAGRACMPDPIMKN